ncbi:Alkylmercury lyase-domain-containing protein, partial [Podospora aff. communis PSN243]
MNNSTLHAFIITTFLTLQRPPNASEIASHFNSTESDVGRALRILADYHGVVLHPNSDRIWIAHPFSATPTTCVVSAGTRQWWGNCVWCSLGVIHLAGGTATLETRLGGIGDAVAVRVENGELLDKKFVVHFPVPMRKAWENVVYTCSVQLLFRNEGKVDEWCAKRGIERGDVRPIEQVWKFARDWYGRHTEEDWTKWTTKEAGELFGRHGLSGPIWALEEKEGRF